MIKNILKILKEGYGKVSTVLLIIIIVLVVAGFAIYKFVPLKDHDSWHEELIEEIIEGQLGVEIDFTPETDEEPDHSH